MLAGGRLLLVTALALLVTLGVRDLVRDSVGGGRAATSSEQSGTGAATFPQLEAEAYATQFALAYLTYDSGAPQSRQQALAPFLPSGADPQLGWDGNGRQTATAAVPAGIDVHGSGKAEVTIAVLTSGGRWEDLAVPVVADGERLRVTGPPALVPGPRQADLPEEPPTGAEDSALEQQMQPNLAEFFAAWAASDATQLAYFETPGADLQGLNGMVRLVNVAGLRISADGGATRSAVATVDWQDSATRAGVTQAYKLLLVQQSGQWHVRQIEPAGP